MFQYSYDTIIGKIFIAEKNGFIAQVSFKEISAEKKETALIKKTYLELAEYFNGKRQIFNVPLSPEGTPFQKKVWEELKKIPYGQTATYKEIAKGIDNEKACRAVGMANNKNPIAVIIPCHRVIGSNGSLTGYAGGLTVKNKLLQNHFASLPVHRHHIRTGGQGGVQFGRLGFGYASPHEVIDADVRYFGNLHAQLPVSRRDVGLQGFGLH